MQHNNHIHHTSQPHPTISLDEILELVYCENTKARCWRCRLERSTENLHVQITANGWCIKCVRCLKIEYFS